MFLGRDILFLALQQIIRQQLRLHILKSETSHSICETLARDALLTEQEDRLLHYIQHLISVGEYLVQILSLSHLLSPASADVDSVAGDVALNRTKGTLAHTPSAVITCIRVDDNFAVCHLCRLDGTLFLHLTDLTAAALCGIDLRNLLTDDTQIIQVRLDTVVGTPAYSDLEFVRKLYLAIAMVKSLMDLFGKSKRIDQAVLTGGTLAGHHRANLGSGTAGLQTVFL